MWSIGTSTETFLRYFTTSFLSYSPHRLPLSFFFHFFFICPYSLVATSGPPCRPAALLTTPILHNVHTNHTVCGLSHGTCTISDVNPGTTKTTHQHKTCPWLSLLPPTPVPESFPFRTFKTLSFYLHSRSSSCSTPQPVVNLISTPTKTARKRHVF